MGFTSRKVDKTVLSRAQREGVGATVRRSIGNPELRNYDPFLMLDEFDTGKPAGFPDHPHRGFETVTYMLEGSFEHEDFTGTRGKIGPGDLQWMTAGKGIVHSEMPFGDGRAHGLQLWVNLSAADKMCDPAYQELKSEQIPVVTKDGVTAKVIAGTALGTTSPVYTRTPAHYIHYTMQPASTVQHVIPEGWTAFLYTLTGTIKVGEGDAATSVDAHHTITLHRTGDGVQIEAIGDNVSFVLICGRPHNEPIVQHGPFVLNTRAEINQAMRDYQSGTNGFEGAADWYSEIGLPITHADRS